MKKFMKKTEGFTLVELIVVIAILGILAGVGTVGYSGYIKKANEAADNQLLATVNHAFAAACLEKGVNSYGFSSASVPVSGGKVGNITTTPSVNGLNDAFNTYFAGNQNLAFKVYTALKYNQTLGGFEPLVLSETYLSIMDLLNDDDITDLKNSEFAKMGVGTLLGSVDMATDIATDLFFSDSPDERIVALINNDANINNLYANLGVDPADYEGGMENEEFQTKLAEVYMPLLQQKAAQLKQIYPDYEDLSEDELMDKANQALLVNNAVFNVATNSSFDEAAFAAKLADGTAKQTIKDNLKEGGDLQAGLAQAALTYSMYLSYASQNDIPVSESAALNDVLEALGDEDFQKYMADSSTNDLKGYQAGLNMVNDSSGNKEAMKDLLINGFSNDNMLGLLQNALG